MVDYDKTMELGRKLLDKHGLADWKFDVVNLQNTAMFGARALSDRWMGYCSWSTKTIYVDWHPRQNTVRQTILHEIAHALTPGDHDHGREWLNKASDIGCTFVHLLPYFEMARRRETGTEGAKKGDRD